MKHLKRALSLTLAVALLTGTLSVHAGAEESAAFTDADQISDWAADAVRHTVGAGILQGDEGWFHPQLTANRATLAVTLQRMLTPAAG